ncbi:MAG: hypothetical protein Tsb0017_16230 [Geothermobacteraceae bacterium]|nr:MAG: hypothetical protein D6751_12685 [Deltaproteobacteria bacterium]
MIWLDLANEQGQELYFDAWKRERCRKGSGELISGLIGDGSYEGEVLVELAERGCELTFVDRFLAPESLGAFLGRVSLDRLRQALEDSLAGSGELALGRRRSDPPAMGVSDYDATGPAPMHICREVA